MAAATCLQARARRRHSHRASARRVGRARAVGGSHLAASPHFACSCSSIRRMASLTHAALRTGKPGGRRAEGCRTTKAPLTRGPLCVVNGPIIPARLFAPPTAPRALVARLRPACGGLRRSLRSPHTAVSATPSIPYQTPTATGARTQHQTRYPWHVSALWRPPARRPAPKTPLLRGHRHRPPPSARSRRQRCPPPSPLPPAQGPRRPAQAQPQVPSPPCPQVPGATRE